MTANVSSVRIASLHIYPIKSCGAIDVPELRFGERGPVHDREWMLIDSTGKFVSQRELPKLTFVKPRLTPDHLDIEIPGASTFRVPLAIQTDRAPIEVSVWEAKGSMAFEESAEISAAFTAFVGKPVRFVRVDPSFERRMKAKYGFQDKALSFVDDMPILLVSQSSLDDLNSKLAKPTLMDSFRPNVVISGELEPFIEDSWKHVAMGSMAFDSSKPCTRCIIVTTNQQTAERNPQVLKTLAGYRRDERGRVVFGRYLVQEKEGTLRVGDPVNS